MKVLFLLLLAPLLVLGDKNEGPDGTKRLCPDGYLYAGDDTKIEDLPMENEPRDVWYEEAARSPEYSCYKIFDEQKTMIQAMHACQEEDAELFTPEDNLELNRVNEIIVKLSDPKSFEKLDFFTSGLYMHDFEGWQWIGSDRSFRNDIVISNDNHGEENSGGISGATVSDCLMVRFHPDSNPKDLAGASLSAVPCNYHAPYVCEARVQTVTYYTWFVANWVDLLLGFLLVILFVALCVSVCSFGSSRPAPSNGRRSVGQRRPRTTDPNQMNGVPMAADLPPSYETTTRIHKPPMNNEAPVRTITTSVGAAPSRMESYRNRGKELFAKVYYYKDTPAAK